MKVKKLHVTNFRSLKNVEIEEFGDTTVFFGLNNAGKSNVLAALHLIFMRKHTSTDTTSPVVNFYSGQIHDSQNNYYNNVYENEITFNVVLTVNKEEFTPNNEIKSLFSTKSKKYDFSFSGTIRPYYDFEQFHSSEIIFKEIKINATKIYSNDNEIHYLPTLDKNKSKQSVFSQAFTELMNMFNDCVTIIGRDRDMLDALISLDQTTNLTPLNFKNYLHNLYLSSSNHHLFEKIDSVFSSEPFGFGHISFANANGSVEIMIKEDSFRLPIKLLGSGVLQCLYIITSIVISKSKIICLEELEQNLSPTLQEKILMKVQDMISAADFTIDQLIISSHSPVYSKISDGYVYLLEKVNGETIKTRETVGEISKPLAEHFAPAMLSEEERRVMMPWQFNL